MWCWRNNGVTVADTRAGVWYHHGWFNHTTQKTGGWRREWHELFVVFSLFIHLCEDQFRPIKWEHCPTCKCAVANDNVWHGCHKHAAMRSHMVWHLWRNVSCCTNCTEGRRLGEKRRWSGTMFSYSFVKLFNHGCFEQKLTQTEGVRFSCSS